MTIALTKSPRPLDEKLLVGIIQTTLDGELAWPKRVGPPMSSAEANRTWLEIRRAISWLLNAPSKPQLIVLPELSVSRNYRYQLKKMACESGCIIIAGLDYSLDDDSRKVRNEAIVIAPDSWKQGRPCRRATQTLVGKTYPAPKEKADLEQLGWEFVHDPNLWVFDAGQFGRFGVCICYDLMDVERPVLYRRQVHHLFVLAYNKDTTSFAHIAEGICRTVYCNVVVCNTGRFGGSVALSPYYKPYRRPTYRHEGQRLTGVQTVELPVAAIEAAWGGEFGTDDDMLKSLPPGFQTQWELHEQDKEV